MLAPELLHAARPSQSLTWAGKTEIVEVGLLQTQNRDLQHTSAPGWEDLPQPSHALVEGNERGGWACPCRRKTKTSSLLAARRAEASQKFGFSSTEASAS